MTQLTLNLQGDLEATGGTIISSSQVASRNYANHSALLEKEKGQMMNATCGTRCYEQFKKLNPNSSSLKMSMVSRILMGEWYSSRCALTWKMKGTKFNRLLFQLQPKTHHIEEIGAGSSELGMLPTPCQYDYNSARTEEKWEEDKKKYANKGVNLQMGLKQMARFQMLPTPTCQDAKGKENSPSQKGKYELAVMVGSGMLPTPTTHDSKHSTTKSASWDKRVEQKHLAETVLNPYIQEKETGKISQLNPRFVAEMMGFPPNWTELPFLNGDQNPSKVTETQ